jgi:Fur family iron response transcriptional regulator
MELSGAQHMQNEHNTRTLLLSKGVNLTKQRCTIADVLFARNQHVTADQLFDAVSQLGHRVSMATIYNTLGLFVHKGLVREIFIDSSRTFYDSNTSQHPHLYNIDTGELTDMNERFVTQYIEQDLPEGTVLEVIDLVVRVRNETS